MNRIRTLEELIKYHKAKYYIGSPEISDPEYDQLEEELRSLDPTNKVLEIIGSSPKGSKKVSHETKMLSLNKTYKQEELLSWANEYQVVSTYKIDGVSCSLVYENGELIVAKTRGDGNIGEDITDKAYWMQNIPTKIEDFGKVEVRGEIFCREESFFKLSEEMQEMGLEKPTSQRNIVAGLIGRKENISLCRYIEFQAFDLIEESLDLKTEILKNRKLKKLGFDAAELVIHTSKKDIDLRIKEAANFMDEGDYLIDGLVFSYNDLSLHEELGNTAHHPRYKIAFKYEGMAKVTSIKKIIWQVSRNGILTPIAEVKPVELSGAKISRVTLHNFGMVKQYNLKKLDKIKIVRSGEVIPKFLELVEESGGNFEFPEACPSCKSKTVIDDIRLRCLNQKCPAQIKEQILNFIQKIGIDDLSSKRLDELIANNMVTAIPDLYDLNMEQLLKVDKVQEKLATKLLSSIEKSKKVDLITFLGALGIQGGAYNKCERVVHAGFDTLEKIKDLTAEKLQEVEGFAEKSSNEFVSSFKEKLKLVEELEKRGFNFKKEEKAKTPITQKKICITGSLSRKRSEIEKEIRDLGGIVVGSVSKNTDYLLTNDKLPSSTKFKKATELEIPVVSEEEFSKLIGKYL